MQSLSSMWGRATALHASRAEVTTSRSAPVKHPHKGRLSSSLDPKGIQLVKGVWKNQILKRQMHKRNK